MQRFEPPALANQLRRQPVEQLGVRRWLPAHAEIAGRGDDPPAEVMLPETIHDHPRGQRVIRPREPGRQRRPPARLSSLDEPDQSGNAPPGCEARSTPGGRGATLGPRDL